MSSIRVDIWGIYLKHAHLSHLACTVWQDVIHAMTTSFHLTTCVHTDQFHLQQVSPNLLNWPLVTGDKREMETLTSEGRDKGMAWNVMKMSRVKSSDQRFDSQIWSLWCELGAAEAKCFTDGVGISLIWYVLYRCRRNIIPLICALEMV